MLTCSLPFSLAFKEWPVTYPSQPEIILIKQISQVEPPKIGQCSLVINRGYLSGSQKTAEHKASRGGEK